MSVIKAISAPFRLAKWCVTGNKLECLESAKRIGKLLKAEKGVWGAMEPKTNVRVYHRRSVPSSHAFASTLQLHKSASRFISDRS